MCEEIVIVEKEIGLRLASSDQWLESFHKLQEWWSRSNKRIPELLHSTRPCINMKSLDNIIHEASSTTISQESNSATTPLPR